MITPIQKKKKKWYPIIAPKEFNHIEIGETLIEDPELPITKKISVNLGAITNDMKKQQISLVFNLTAVKDNKIETKLSGYETSLSYTKRLTRSAKAKIESSFAIKTKDNINVRIKPTVIVKLKVKRSILTLMQKKMIEVIINKAPQLTFNEFINEIISFRLQKEIQKELKPIYPLFSILITSFKIETKERKETKKESPAEETEEEVEEVIEEEIEEIPEVEEKVVEEEKKEKPKKEKKKKE